MSDKIESVSFIGSGNVAFHMANKLFNGGVKIQQICSRSKENAELLSQRVEASVCGSGDQLNTEVDLLVIAVKDDAYSELLPTIPSGVKAVVHTSGSLFLSQLKDVGQYQGVIYPVYSFNKSMEVDWQNLPLCIEGSNDEFVNSLFELCTIMSSNTCYVNSEQRQQLHLAAIMANNFTNYLYSLAFEITTKHNMPFKLLQPLIIETAKRLEQTDPFLFQTGPAKRGDKQLIAKHIALLENEPEIKKVYEYLSEMIIKKGQ